MDDLVFSKAANGENSCALGKIRLHSSYNPSKEAERFANEAHCDFSPSHVIVTEPALSFCLPFLKKRFPDSKFCAVRYTESFSEYDTGWDKIFNVKTGSLSSELFLTLGDEGIISSLFISWHPSEKAFPLEYECAWNEIKKAILKSRTVLGTRSYFGKRWAKNTLRFFIYSKNQAYLQSGTKPVIVCASGKSLESSIPFLRSERKRYFLLSVSSALSPLLHADIVPDLCISTDGGFWAKKHISRPLKQHNIPLAISPEASCFSEIMENATIIPLSYGDGFPEAFFSSAKTGASSAERNGTVSGTAVKLARKLTTGPVFVCGLDLAPNKGHAHTQPNELEIEDSLMDTRLCPQETRLTPRTFDSPSLNVYRDWFSRAEIPDLYRLSADYKYSAPLGHIPDVNWAFFDSECNKSEKQNVAPAIFPCKTKNKFYRNPHLVYEEASKNMLSREWVKNILPTQALIYERSTGNEMQESSRIKLESDMKKFYTDLYKWLGKEEIK